MPAVLRYVIAKALELLRNHLGFREYGNNGNPYSEWQYGVEYPRGGWCMSFYSWIAYHAGFRFGSRATHGDRGFSHTDRFIAWARDEGLLRDKTWHAQPNDALIFKWDGSGALTGTDHIEAVEHDDGRRRVTIGGNTGDAVSRRVRDNKYVVAVVALSASTQAQAAVTADLLKFLAAVDRLKKRVAQRPLQLGDEGDLVEFYAELCVARGLRTRVPNMRRYGPGARDATWHAKKIMRAKGLLRADEKRGDRAGVKVVDWLTSS